MRKEQFLLVAAVALGAAVVLMSAGKYTEVGASALPDGKPVKVTTTVQPEPLRGLSGGPLAGRSVSAPVRPEVRPPLPDIPAPAPLPLAWVRPVPTPGPAADRWRGFRERIAAVKVAEKPGDETAEKPGAGEAPPADIPVPGLPTVDLTKEARLVTKSGEEQPGKLEPGGALKGQPDWAVLEKWPHVTFRWGQYNKKGGIIGWVELVGPDDLQNFERLALRKTLENEFREERIRRLVRDTDRTALVQFATWVYETLPSHVSADGGPPYGVRAIRLAIDELEKARALANDLAVTKQLYDYYRAAYDLQGAVRVVREFVDKASNETPTMIFAGEVLERAGLLSAARQWYEKAAATGDAEARLHVGLVLEKLGDPAAAETLRAVSTIPAQSARALTALARMRLVQGQVDEAAALAEQARKEGAPGLAQVLGSIQYAKGRYEDAEKSFAAAAAESPRTEARSNRGMALALAGNLDGAAAEYQYCLDNDPLNLVDPLLGLGDAWQRRGESTKANDCFETALARWPDHPWTLLRLGTLRLRDGQPDKAVALAMHLLEVAPGSVEGLWLAGRAEAALEKPDWDKAVAYLRRAFAKEPDNRDALNEYARSLLAAGRIEEAAAELEKGVDVTKGIARNDARVLALHAYASFLAKRPIEAVQEALTRAARAQPDDATREWVQSVRKTIEEWDRSRIWRDDFARPATGQVGNGWKEFDQAQGILIQLNDKGQAVFSGKPRQAAAPRDTGTRLERDEDLGRFVSVEATFRAAPGVEVIFHLFAGQMPDRQGAGGGSGRRTQGFELGLGCDRNGNMVLWQVAGRGGEAWEQIVKDAAGANRPWPADDLFHTVRITRRDGQKGAFEIEFDDEKIAGPKGTLFEVGAFSAQPNKPFTLGFLVDAEAGTPVEVTVDSVQVRKTK